MANQRALCSFYSRTRRQPELPDHCSSGTGTSHITPVRHTTAGRSNSLLYNEVLERDTQQAYHRDGSRMGRELSELDVNSDFSFDDDMIDNSNNHSTPFQVSSHIRQGSQSQDHREIIAMLQQQQAVLQKLVDSQNSLEIKHQSLKESFSALKENVDQLQMRKDESPGNSDSSGRRKRIITRSLSVSHLV